MAQENLNVVKHYPDDQEIFLGPLWNSIKETFFYVLKRWWAIAIWMAAFACIGWAYQIWYGKKYIANATFSVQGQNAQNTVLGTALAYANTIGIGTQSHSQGYDNNFFASLLQSQRVIKEALLTRATCFGKDDYLANHYITLSHWREGTLIHKGWNKVPHLKNFYFIHGQVDQLSPLEDSILTVIYQTIISSNLVVTYDAAQPFNTATFNTRNYDFSKAAMSSLLNISLKYYNQNISTMSNANFKLADKRVDSLAKALRSVDYKVASLHDVNNFLVQQKGAVNLNEAIRDQAMLNTQFSAAVNNLELARVAMLSSAPILQIIDDPQFATILSQVSLMEALVVGAILGFIFGTVFVVISKAVKDSNAKYATDYGPQVAA